MLDLIEYFCLPKKTIKERKIFKNNLIGKTNSPLIRQKIKEDISTVFLENHIETSYVKSFDSEEYNYIEIHVFKIKLNKKGSEKKIAGFLHKVIPSPNILIFENEDSFLMSLCHKKKNKKNKESRILEDLLFTEWIDFSNLREFEVSFLASLDIKKIDKKNLFELYQSLINRVCFFEFSSYTDKYEVLNKEDLDKKTKILNEIKELKILLNKTRSEKSKSSNFGQTSDLNLKITEIRKSLKEKELLL